MLRPGRYWTRLLFHSLVVTSATILVTSAVLYGVFQDLSIRLTTRSVMDKLNQTAYSTHFLKEAAVASTMQIYFDKDVKRYLNTDEEPTIEVSNALNSLLSYVNATNYIFSVSLYNGGTDTLLSTRNFSEETEKAFVKAYITERIEKKADLKPVPRRLLNSSTTASPVRYQNVYTYVMFDYSLPDRHIDNAVILNIREDWIQDTMQSMNALTHSDTFILDQTGKVIHHPEKELFLTDLSRLPHIRRILDSGESTGYLHAAVNGEATIATYVTSSLMGWVFVNIMPREEILRDVLVLRNRTILISFLLLMIGLGLSYAVSKRMYSPVEKLTRHLSKGQSQREGEPRLQDEFAYIEGIYADIRQKHESLEESMRDRSALVKASFLKQLILQGEWSQTGSIGEFITQLGLRISEDQPFTVAVLCIDGYDAFIASNNRQDRALLLFCIRNISEELLGDEYPCESTEIAEDQVALLIQLPPETFLQPNTLPDRLFERMKDIQAAATKHLSLSLTIACAAAGMDLSACPACCEQAIRIARQRRIYGLGALLGPEMDWRESPAGRPYDEALESRLLDALKLGKRELSHRLLNEQVDAAVAGGVIVLEEAILRLVLAFSRTAAQLGLEGYGESDMTPGTMVRDLNRLETAEQVRQTMHVHVNRMLDGLAFKKSDRQGKLVERINALIGRNHTDKNLSLQTLADSVDLSAAHLGKVYRESTGKSVADRINGIRAEKAADLLRISSLTVNEIADQVGFLSIGHFYTVFRKEYGMTPNDYRKKVP